MAEEVREDPVVLSDEGRQASGSREATHAPGLTAEEAQALRAELAALREQQAQFAEDRKRTEHLEQQFGQIRKVFAPETTPDSTLDYFTDPVGKMQAYGEALREKILKEVEAKTFQRTFWQDFYTQHPELKGYESIVNQTILDSEELSGLGFTADAAAKVAQATRERLLTAAQRFAGSGTDGIRLVEGGGGTRGGRLPAGEAGGGQPSRPKSVGDIIRAQREARSKRGA